MLKGREYTMDLTNREKEIIYFGLSRLLDDLRDLFYTGEALPTY